MSTTVAAISTPHAPGGIGIIRISGDRALEIADRVFAPVAGKPLSQLRGYTCAFGHVQTAEGRYLDEAVATVFRAPKSYTGEDVVELSCHGGLYNTKRVLRTVLESGAVPAPPGEFTKRAFLNGKMTLTQAESVMDLIGAQGEAAARMAFSAREGALYRRITIIREALVSAAAQLSAWVDFPDDDIPELGNDALGDVLQNAEEALETLLTGFDAGRVVREGVETVIVGRPNVGKSTLMNLLAGCEKSIVTPIAGTTRDIVEETVRLGDVLLRLADTAGIRNTEDDVERIGVDRAHSRLRTAQLILAVFDSSEPLTPDDHLLIEALPIDRVIAIVNKSDLPKQVDESYIKSSFKHIVYISAHEGLGVEELTKQVEALFLTSGLQADEGVLATERQRDAALRAHTAVKGARVDLNMGMTLDAINVSIDEAIAALLSLTGESVTEAVVEDVFSRFCVGK